MNRTLNFTTTKSVDFSTGLVAAYKFENNTDDYTTNHDGTPSNITYGTGKVGNQSIYNGTNSKVVIPYSSDFSFTDGVNDLPFTMSMWLNPSKKTGNQWVINKRNEGSLREYQLAFVDNQLYFNLFGSGAALTYIGFDFDSSVIIPIGVDTHFAFSYTPNVGFLAYVNGLPINVIKEDVGGYTGQVDSGNPLQIGTASWVTGYDYFGKLDEFYIWKDRRLSAYEIYKLYKVQNSGGIIFT